MSLLRAILALIVVLILAHIVLVRRLGYEPTTHEAIAAVYSLAEPVEYPAWLLLANTSFYVVALAAAGGYLILYILVGMLRRRMYHQP